MACVVVSSLALPHSVTLTVHTQLAGGAGGVALSERGHVSLSCKVGHAHEISDRARMELEHGSAATQSETAL